MSSLQTLITSATQVNVLNAFVAIVEHKLMSNLATTSFICSNFLRFLEREPVVPARRVTCLLQHIVEDVLTLAINQDLVYGQSLCN
jgi:hypothetical protein